MKRDLYRTRAIILIVVLHLAIFWFDHKLKQSPGYRKAKKEQPMSSLADVNASGLYFSGETFPSRSKFTSQFAPDDSLFNISVKTELWKAKKPQRILKNKGPRPATSNYCQHEKMLRYMAAARNSLAIGTKNNGDGNQQKVSITTDNLRFTGSRLLTQQPAAGTLVFLTTKEMKINK